MPPQYAPNATTLSSDVVGFLWIIIAISDPPKQSVANAYYQL